MSGDWRDRVIAAEARGSFLTEDLSDASSASCCFIGETVARLAEHGITEGWMEVDVALMPVWQADNLPALSWSIGGAARRLVRANDFALVHLALDACDDYVMLKKRGKGADG